MRPRKELQEHISDRLKQQIAGSPETTSGPMVGVNICVVGGGFVGLVAAAGFAQFGHSVVCVEKNPQRLKMLREGRIPFYEKDLESLIRKNVECRRLSFSDDLVGSVEGQQAIFLAVGTPSSETGRTDLTALEEVANLLSGVAVEGQIIVLKSTVPVGTGAHVQEILRQNTNGTKPAAVVNNPEFLREGNAVYDFFNPQRIVIGGSSSEAVEIIAHIFRLGMTHPVPIVTTNNETAEMIKYASNAFLTTKVGFINELAGLCDKVSVNVLEVARAMGLDPRIGGEFLEPGPGWGGSCFRKDLTEFAGLARSVDHPMLITGAVLKANRCQHQIVVDKIERISGSLENARIGVLGLSFKADTSDMRDSPAIPIIRQLLEKGASVIAYDPKANGEAAAFLPDVELAETAYDIAKDADCLVILTEWQEFQLLDFKRLADLMNSPNMVDARNLLTPEMVRRYGFNYTGMGQG